MKLGVCFEHMDGFQFNHHSPGRLGPRLCRGRRHPGAAATSEGLVAKNPRGLGGPLLGFEATGVWVIWARSVALSLSVLVGGTLRGTVTCNPSPAFSQTPPQTKDGCASPAGWPRGPCLCLREDLSEEMDWSPLPVPTLPCQRDGPLPCPRGPGMAGRGLRPGASRSRHARLGSLPGRPGV